VLASPEAPAAFAIWGEQSPNVRIRPPRAPRKRPTSTDGRSPFAPRPAQPAVVVPAHPFALSDDGVRHALSIMGLTRWATQTNVRHVYACLPSLPSDEPPYGAPHRSTEPIESVANLKFGVWRVPAVVLDEVSTVSLLPRIAAATAANPSALGADLHAWVIAARFALSLLARQMCVPRLQSRDDELISRWSPLLDDSSDRATLRTIERTMPAAATALTWGADGRRGTAADALADYLAATIDRVARRARPLPGDLSDLPATLSAWLNALTRDDPIVHLQGEGAQALRRQIGNWTDQTPDDAADDAFRLCFRLVPPGQDGAPLKPDKPWRLEYLLQATDDPSLLVPVEAVWRHRGQTARFLTRRFDQPQERVLAGLGRASRAFAPIETSLRSARPEACDLSTREAADLVRDKALLLKANGFGVLLPGLDTRLSVRLRLRGREREPDPLKTEGPGLLSFNSLVSYDWQLALGDQALTPEEFEMLASLKEPLVQLRGRWVDVRPDQIERALAFIQKHQNGREMPLVEALQTALAPTALDGVQIAEVDAAGWIDTLLADIRQGARAEQISAQPEGFQGTLRGYQQRGVAWLATLQRYNLGALLADDMGLGKTAQLIALLLVERNRVGPTLVVSPTSVVGNWRHELSRFAPGLRVLVHHGAERAEGDDLVEAAGQQDVVLSTYSLLHRDESALTRVKWNGLVLDEAQNVKNASTRAAQAARAINARWRVALTGTPVENRLADLWSIFQVINPGYLGSAEEFRREFALPIERASDADAASRLKSLTAPFILRRVKTDRSVIADLPDKQEMKVYCSLTREQATLYEAVLQDTMRQIAESEGMQRRGLVLALLTRLKQVCNHPALLMHDGSPLEGRSGKLARVREMLEEVVASDDRALVFTQYAEMGRLLQEHLREALDREVVFLHGGTPMAERDRLVNEFQNDANGPPVFILSLKAGGTGLNLTRANHVFHFDRWWNPAVENQATDRAFRIGQTRNVQVHKYVCSGTFEETLDDLIERKVALAEAIVGTSEAWITEMSTDDLRQLFGLRREEAVAEDDA
jgi:SNF2 domain-containing protein/SNF2 helicase protein/helicase-like protein